MKNQLTGTVVGGSIRLDQPLELADDSRIFVTIVSVEDTKARWAASLAALRRLRAERPLRSHGLQFTRDELHERR